MTTVQSFVDKQLEFDAPRYVCDLEERVRENNDDWFEKKRLSAAANEKDNKENVLVESVDIDDAQVPKAKEIKHEKKFVTVTSKGSLVDKKKEILRKNGAGSKNQAKPPTSTNNNSKLKPTVPVTPLFMRRANARKKVESKVRDKVQDKDAKVCKTSKYNSNTNVMTGVFERLAVSKKKATGSKDTVPLPKYNSNMNGMTGVFERLAVSKKKAAGSKDTVAKTREAYGRETNAARGGKIVAPKGLVKKNLTTTASKPIATIPVTPAFMKRAASRAPRKHITSNSSNGDTLKNPTTTVSRSAKQKPISKPRKQITSKPITNPVGPSFLQRVPRSRDNDRNKIATANLELKPSKITTKPYVPPARIINSKPLTKPVGPKLRTSRNAKNINASKKEHGIDQASSFWP